eukprot:1161694-Pelagomonas_calceolata.AAC.10
MVWKSCDANALGHRWALDKIGAVCLEASGEGENNLQGAHCKMLKGHFHNSIEVTAVLQIITKCVFTKYCIIESKEINTAQCITHLS